MARVRSSIPCLDLAVFESECSGSVSVDPPPPLPAVDMDWDVLDPPELGEVVGSGTATITYCC